MSDEEMLEQEKDELDEFIVDENEPINKNLLALIIKPYVNTIGKNEVIDYTEKFEESASWKKVLIYLCCRKVMFLKNLVKEEPVGPKAIAEKTNISVDSAKNISRDKNLKKLILNYGGKYSIPNYKLNSVKKVLLENEPER